MLEGKLTKEQINLIVQMVQDTGNRGGPQTYPALGDLMRALAQFRAPEAPETETKDLEDDG